MKKCIACGMPMEETSDYAMGDTSRDYCKFCARPDGSMQNYDEKLTGTVDFIVKTQGVDPRMAKVAAIQILSGLPAWQDHS